MNKTWIDPCLAAVASSNPCPPLPCVSRLATPLERQDAVRALATRCGESDTRGRVTRPLPRRAAADRRAAGLYRAAHHHLGTVQVTVHTLALRLPRAFFRPLRAFRRVRFAPDILLNAFNKWPESANATGRRVVEANVALGAARARGDERSRAALDDGRRTSRSRRLSTPSSAPSSRRPSACRGRSRCVGGSRWSLPTEPRTNSATG
jgi:hypothetical protein